MLLLRGTFFGSPNRIPSYLCAWPTSLHPKIRSPFRPKFPKTRLFEAEKFPQKTVQLNHAMLQNRAHVFWQKRGIVYDLYSQSVEIKTIKDINSGCGEFSTIPIKKAHPNFVDIFVDWAEGEKSAEATSGGPGRSLFVGRLDLRKLGVKRQIYRRLGGADTVYVVKQTSQGEEKPSGVGVGTESLQVAP